ncbi:MAG: tRNA/rRNA methyltransferase [Bdellovibrionota bacterium]
MSQVKKKTSNSFKARNPSKRNQPSKSQTQPQFNIGKPQRDSRSKPRDDGHFSKVYGINACKVFAKQKSSSIIRAFFTQNVAPQFSDLMKKLAAQKKVYRIVSEEELEKVSQSQHHEGVCFNIELDPPIKLSQWLNDEKKKKQSYLLALENVGNPHNLGAIMRLAAHFGVDGIAMTNPKALQSGAARRTAEGGAEFIKIIECESMKSLISAAKKEGYSVATTSSHKGKSLYETEFSDKCVLLFGEEGPGLSKDILSSGDFSIQIPGTQNVESLNVSSSIAIILGEIWKQKK